MLEYVRALPFPAPPPRLALPPLGPHTSTFAYTTASMTHTADTRSGYADTATRSAKRTASTPPWHESKAANERGGREAPVGSERRGEEREARRGGEMRRGGEGR